MTNNPYESPPISGFQEAKRKMASVHGPDDATIRHFLMLNRFVSIALMGAGIALTFLVPLLVGGSPDGLQTAGVTFVVGIVVTAWGHFHFKRNLAAFLLTGLTTATSYFLMAPLLFIVLFAIWKALPAQLPGSDLVFVFGTLVLIGAVLAVPTWLAAQAIRWSVQGIDVDQLQPTSDAQNGDTKRSSVL